MSVKRVLHLCRKVTLVTMTSLILSTGTLFAVATAQNNTTEPGSKEFSLQVTPSPLVETIRPGQKSEFSLKIRNASTSVETLQMELRSFDIDEDSGEVLLGTDAPAEIAPYVSFAQPTFQVNAGEWFEQKVIVDVPEEASFSYSFAILISREKQGNVDSTGASIEGSVAVFTLLSVDKPGATRSFAIDSISSAKSVYEFLPASITVRIRNTGNTPVAPGGTVYLQRGSVSDSPIMTVGLNKDGGYVLPDKSRDYTIEWNDGFPRFENVSSDGSGEKSLRWNFSDISKIRFGKYTAKVVAIYDDGTRDVPVEGMITFWVIPWKFLLLFALVIAVFLIGTWTLAKKSSGFLKKIKDGSRKDTKTE